MTRKQDAVSLDSFGFTTLPATLWQKARGCIRALNFLQHIKLQKLMAAVTAGQYGRQVDRCWLLLAVIQSACSQQIPNKAGWAVWWKTGCWHSVDHFHCRCLSQIPVWQSGKIRIYIWQYNDFILSMYCPFSNKHFLTYNIWICW